MGTTGPGYWTEDAQEGCRLEFQARKASRAQAHGESFLPQETHLEAPPGDGVNWTKKQVPSTSF